MAQMTLYAQQLEAIRANTRHARKQQLGSNAADARSAQPVAEIVQRGSP
jgi:hypothetical protein